MKKVLIVDDIPTIRRQIKKMILQFEDCQIFEAGNGVEAMYQANRFTPDIIFLDIMMPVKNGMEVLPSLKKKLPSTQIYMASSLASPSTVEWCKSNGATGYLEKPFHQGQFMEIFDEVANPNLVAL